AWPSAAPSCLWAGPSWPDGAAQAAVAYSLGGVVGTDLITASVPSAGSATFGVQALPARPAAITAISGGGQSAPIGTTMPAPFIVKVTDAGGFPVMGAGVTWAATKGADLTPAHTTTDDQGQSSNTPQLGPTVGAIPGTATAA